MSRPEFIENTDIQRWSEIIDNDDNISVGLSQSPIIREVMYAGLYLFERLYDLRCDPELIARIRYTAGKFSFGRDPWEAHLEILKLYMDNKLIFEEDFN